MRNLRMQEKLSAGEAIDVSGCARTADGDYIMPPGMFVEGKDYCDAKAEVWMWSIGRKYGTDEVRASATMHLYGDSMWECLWLR